MSVTLSPPVRIFAFVGVIAAVGLAAFMLLAGRSAGDEGGSATPPATTPARTTPAPTAPTTPTAPVTPARPRPSRTVALPPSGFPLPVHRALRKDRVAIVVVYAPRAAVDSVVRAEARAAARASRTPLVQLSAFSERLVQPLVAKTGVLPNPAVLVVERSGTVTATLGVTDSETITQAVVQARR
jgi:hypothetical protein